MANLIIKGLKNRYNNVVKEVCECSECGAYIYDRKQKHCDICGSEFVGTKTDEVVMKPSEEQTEEYIRKNTSQYTKTDEKGFVICPACNQINFVVGQAYCDYCGQAFKW